MEHERTVVLSDVHGFSDPVKRVIDHYGTDVHYVFNGDVVDRGPDSKGTVELIKQLGENATLLFGNHEWTMLAAMTDMDIQRRPIWRDHVWLAQPSSRRLESGTLRSYGIESSLPTAYQARDLRETMTELGHLQLLQASEMYYESEDMLIIHAGTDNGRSWHNQRRDLDAAKSLARACIFSSEPAQFVDFRLCDVSEPPRDIYQKTLVTGHSHDRGSADNRVWRGGRIHPVRVKLATHLQGGDPLLTYESWTGQVKAFAQSIP